MEPNKSIVSDQKVKAYWKSREQRELALRQRENMINLFGQVIIKLSSKKDFSLAYDAYEYEYLIRQKEGYSNDQAFEMTVYFIANILGVKDTVVIKNVIDEFKPRTPKSKVKPKLKAKAKVEAKLKATPEPMVAGEEAESKSDMEFIDRIVAFVIIFFVIVASVAIIGLLFSIFKSMFYAIVAFSILAFIVLLIGDHNSSIKEKK
jgi:hypothetical protein